MRQRRVAAALAEELEARAEAPAAEAAALVPAGLAVEGGCEEVGVQQNFRGWLLQQPGADIYGSGLCVPLLLAMLIMADTRTARSCALQGKSVFACYCCPGVPSDHAST